MSSLLRKYREFLDRFSPFLLVGYFVLTYVPYFVGRFSPLLSFFNSYDVYYRSALSLIFIIITLSNYLLSNNRKVTYLLLFIVVCFYFVIGALCVPSSITVRHIFSNSHSIIDVSLNVGFKDLVVGLLNSFFDVYFCFYLLVFGITAINKKTIKIFLLFVFISSIIESFLTFILDASSYRTLFSLSFDNVYDLNISGTFQSKNGLGFLLFQGVLSSFFLINQIDKKWKKIIYILGLVLIMIVSLLSFCKTSAIISFFGSLSFALSSIFKNKTKIIKRIIYALIILLFIAFFALIMFVPQLTTIKGIGGVVLSIKNTVLERVQIWYEATYLLEMPQIFIGYSKGVSGYLLHLVDETLSSYYFHNGFVTILVNYGLIGLIAYIFIVSSIYKRSKYLNDNLHKIYYIIFWSSITYTCFEAYHLFLSGSPVVMFQSVILVYLPVLYSNYLERSKANSYVVSQEDYYVISI